MAAKKCANKGGGNKGFDERDTVLVTRGARDDHFLNCSILCALS
jgi:hypothetical protein